MIRTIKFGSVLIGIALLAFGFALLMQTSNKAEGSANNVQTQYMRIGGGAYTGTAVATTTSTGVTFLAAGATTTFPFYSERGDVAGITIAMTASTSLGRLVYTYDVSNTDADCANDPNKCDWAIPAIASTSAPVTGVNTVTFASTTPTYTWQPDGALNATSTLIVPINNNGYKFTRVKANCTASACALWMSASVKGQQP